MKNFILRTLNVILNIVMILSVIYSLFNIVMSFLPEDTQRTFYDFLHMSSEYIATFSVSATINAGVLVASKIASTVTRINMQTKLLENEKVMQNDILVNEKVIEKSNEIISSLRGLIGLSNALLTVQEVTTKRNISASELLVNANEKEAYQKALLDIEKAKDALVELNNITNVYEKTEVKEVEVIKEKDELEGRV